MRQPRSGPSRFLDAAMPADARLLTIAADHLKRFGARQVTVVSIADAAGMTHANVYR
jgi:AcrR family transcriptional regulator